MEVHAHTHTARKKWTHYLWEFLMLFLAVFCGFLAENFREHQVEHQREKQYMQSLITDLTLDTAMLNMGFPRKEARIKAIDTVFRYFKTHGGVKSIPGKLFKTFRRTTWDLYYRRNNITINQLKNSGGMRLIRKKNVSDSIAAYDAEWEWLEYYHENHIKTGQIGQDFAEKLVNANDLLAAYNENETEGIVSNISDSMTIRINTTYLNEHLNFLMRQKVFTRQDMNLHKHLEQRAEWLMALIKKEYHLK